ncbi:unnamed protein product [Trifolium pratense]|uniref:Uncharacterized protein n=1 Tax=Trifolium pratense TaxID=57577 RepID=A0ACB0IV28_TRIPR|nr:unnamed protein product [Trifolium pratense]
MGWKNEKGEHLEWAFQTTETFIELIYNRVEKKQMEKSSFKIEIWEDINNELKNITGFNFGVDKLKQKFNRLRDEFSVGYWCEPKYNSKGKLPTKFIEYGLKHDYDMDMLGEIFNKLDRASAQDKPAVDVLQKAIEEDHVSKVVHIDPEPIEVHGDLQEFEKKRKTVVSSSDYQYCCEFVNKNHTNTKLDVWSN